MIRFIGKRLQQSLILLFLASVVCFTLVVSAPGTVAVLIAELRGAIGTLGYVEQIEEEIGLNRPLLVRYADWLGDVVQGDFGISYRTGHDVIADLTKRMTITGMLVAGGAAVAAAGSLVPGFLGMLWPVSVGDRATRALALVGASIPASSTGRSPRSMIC